MHWLPITVCKQYKIPFLVFKAQLENAPKYLSDYTWKPLSASFTAADNAPCALLIFFSRSFVPTTWTALAKHQAFVVVGYPIWNGHPPLLRAKIRAGFPRQSNALREMLVYLTRSSYFQLRRLRAIHRYVYSMYSSTMTSTVPVFACFRINYCNSLLIGLHKVCHSPTPSGFKAGARLIACLPKLSHTLSFM